MQGLPLQPVIDLRGISQTNIAAIIVAARTAGQEGPVAYHLVGAKLALRFPDDVPLNRSYAEMTAGEGVDCDYRIGSTAFRVITDEAEIAKALNDSEKCIRNGNRVLLLVPAAIRRSAQKATDDAGLGDGASVQGIEAFVATNLDELAKYRPADLESGMIAFLIVYNARVAEVESDTSLQIEIPAVA